MKKIMFLLLSLFVTFNTIFAQVDVISGMGIGFVYSPSLNSYLEKVADGKLNAFSTSAEFYAEVAYTISPKYQIGIEYVYNLYDFSSSYSGSYTLSYIHQKPSVLGYYVLSGNGYKFKFGAGVGLRILDLTENYIIDDDYNAVGFGFLVRTQGNTKLGDNFYANIGSTLRTDFVGVPTNKDKKFNNDININSLSISVNIGVSYFF